MGEDLQAEDLLGLVAGHAVPRVGARVTDGPVGVLGPAGASSRVVEVSQGRHCFCHQYVRNQNKKLRKERKQTKERRGGGLDAGGKADDGERRKEEVETHVEVL